ncbi:potassium channel family protein [Sphingomonas sp. ID1715]|uniref:potassium channel family protein n=1 Tax=Sphingomonas sp. ID1715 TaxID=1656898 RepID=UPI001488A018|nr:potassium channel family protein [Sphingomonas sp. ID1715]NNM76321.1 potassium channel family protein [Sphingomonas sp. ID1715]
MRVPPQRPPTLRRPSSTPVWLQIGWRILLVLALIGLAVGVHWLDRDGLRDSAGGEISLTDILYFTMISVTTTGYGDIVPVTEQARMFDAFVVTPIRIFVVMIFFGTAYTFVIRRTWDKWRMRIIQKTLTDHIVVAGFGVTGREATEELIARGTKAERVVVVDCEAEALAEAESLGCTVLQGDATRDATLQAVRIAEAETLLVTAGRDDTAILITLTARHLAPDIRISTTIRAEDNELLARQAGATTVVNPVSFAGLLLAGSCEGTHTTEYLTDLASAAGRVQLVERCISGHEEGRPLSSLTTGLGVRIIRAGRDIGFWQPEAQRLESGDRVVEIVPAVTA